MKNKDKKVKDKKTQKTYNPDKEMDRIMKSDWFKNIMENLKGK